ncbi:MvaI/BcnI family restriction endonuclease [Thiolinea disciformis]|uniref:MvaI/BcnI family restriction endonuclease n=1 Tax=Thiolinea disciformis TaxID=125614 RepID=UPI00035E9892|nr:MvaI/BcnI family restriction endonuclease [Thiolinea disciformis]
MSDKTFTKEGLIQELQKIRGQGWIETTRPLNDGNVGNLLEDLLGIDENNLPIPNATEWELKTQRKASNSLLTLFHMEPSPRALKFVPKILLPHYGWTHQDAGINYTINEKSFRQTIRAGVYSNRGFSIRVNKAEQKIEVHFDPTKVDLSIQGDWLTSIRTSGKLELDPAPYWGFNDFFHKLGSKLHNCFYVTAIEKKENGKNFFKYEDILMLKDLSLDKTIDALEAGLIYIDFDARTGHNHGTKFRIHPKNMINLYTTHQIY